LRTIGYFDGGGRGEAAFGSHEENAAKQKARAAVLNLSKPARL
jgi:hypothetical protein